MANKQVINMGDGDYYERIQGDHIQVTVNRSVIQLINPSQEAIEQLRQIANIPTEVQPNLVAEAETNRWQQQEIKNMHKSLDEILNVVKGLEQQGKHPQGIQAGNVQISRIDVLVKKAVLLKTEAEQLFFDQLERHKSKIEQAKAQSIGNTFQIDLNNIFVDFNSELYSAKLNESLKLLWEANKLDPANTEVLLHIAQILIQLTPDEPHETRKIIYRILNLLNEPVSEVEKFRKAQATFLLATSSNHIHIDLLNDARAIFTQIGRTEWVQQCDYLLQQNYNRSNSIQPLPDYAKFQPVGNWQIQITDGSIITAIFYPNGTFQGVQLTGLLGQNISLIGQWVFIPQTQVLQVQGLINGWQPYMLAIVVRSIQDNKFYGTGSDGRGYFFTRV